MLFFAFPQYWKGYLLAIILSFPFIFFMKNYMRRNEEIFVKIVKSSKEELKELIKKIWPNILPIPSMVVLQIILKIPIFWMGLAWYIVLLPEHNSIYKKAIDGLNKSVEITKDLNRKTNICLVLLVLYYFFIFLKGVIHGMVG